jgi:hypothetical protein
MTITKKFMLVAAIAAVAFGLSTAVRESRVLACGCFTPPDPSVPIVQAGERILFEIEDGVVTSHVQIQYSGPAEEFGWLLPLPSVPELGVGTDELFTQLIAQTQPKYGLTAQYHGNCGFDPNRSSSDGDSASGAQDAGAGAPPGEPGGSPLVIQDSVGPYDYAVLKADSKQPMLDWLAENRFFVPTGTDDAVDPYINPGAYFLALKLRKGNDVGDIQPVVIKYASDLPMIPIILTSVAADPDMGVQVWVLGDSRAIPRNYFHTRINDAEIDWLNFGQNYADVVTRAVDEADGHHSFVTEYAGTSAVMQDVLDYPGRFGDIDQLQANTDAVNYVEYLLYNGYWGGGNQAPFFQPQLGSQLRGILASHLPVPAALLADGLTADEYYFDIRYYTGDYRTQYPEKFVDLDLDYDAVALTAEIEERVVVPTREAGAMFIGNPYLTRMFTTLSPTEMTKDPVFSFNPELIEVSNVHQGELHYFCGVLRNDDPATTPARIVTENGFELELPDGTGVNPWADVAMPWSQYTEILREEGQPEVVADNTALIAAALGMGKDGGGCAAVSRGGGAGLGGGAALLGAALALIVRWRRRR